jgi:DNA topoisomerase-3
MTLKILPLSLLFDSLKVMKTLILTEKPSVARDFAYALGIPTKGDGFFENDTTIITFAIGHLMELKRPDEYNPKWKRWDMSLLPILPDRLSYKANSKTKKQLNIVIKQLKRKDLGRIVLATDAGREGELIGRTVINEVKPKAPLFRFWTSQALSPEVINESMGELKTLAEYDRLYYAGRSRQSADWLIGMNLSRLATIKMGDTFSVGRVQTAVLALIVARRKEIDKFKPEPFYTITAKFDFSDGELIATWFDPDKKTDSTHIKNEVDVKKILKNCTDNDVIVNNLKKEKKKQVAPELFSLTELQKVANRMYGFPAKKTLDLAQALYEKHKCLSYPRTDARVLGSKSFSQASKLVEVFKESHSDYFKYFDQSKLSAQNLRVFNDAKLTDHHALIPLKNAKLSGDEAKIFELVLKRFVSVFSRDFEYEETKIITRVDHENFKSRGQQILCLGWKSLSGGDREKFLPSVKDGEVGSVNNIAPEKKMTKPPSEYTEATLLQDMVNPARLVEERELKEVFRGEVGLGTQATRAQIIETLLMRNYVERKEKMIVSLPKGMTLVDNLKKMKLSKVLTNPEETAKWELKLEDISQGSGDPRAFMLGIRKFIVDSTEEWKNASVDTVQKVHIKRDSSQATVIGECPLCKSSVVDSLKGYSCERWREGCKFKIWKKIAGKQISMTQAKKILSKGKSDNLKGFKSKAGKPFNAVLEVKGDGVSFLFE